MKVVCLRFETTQYTVAGVGESGVAHGGDWVEYGREAALPRVPLPRMPPVSP